MKFPSLAGHGSIAIDVETRDPDLMTLGPGSHRGAFICGIAVATEKGFKQYFPIRHKRGKNLNRKQVLTWLKRELNRPDQPKVGANLIYDLEMLDAEGVTVAGPYHDIQIAEPLIDETHFRYGLDTLAQRYLHKTKDEAGMISWIVQHLGVKEKDAKNYIWECPPEIVRDYAIADVLLPLAIWKRQYTKLQRLDLLRLYDTEQALLPVLLHMRKHGVRVDVREAKRLHKQFGKTMRGLQRQLNNIAGLEVQPWAAASIAKAFDGLGLTYELTNKTKKPSFRSEWLKQHDHAIAKLIVDIRKLDKLRNTFLGAIIERHTRGRIYTQFHQLRSDEGGTICVTADTLFLSSRGYVPVDTLRIGDQVLSHRGVPQPITDIIDNGIKPVYKITLANGMSIKCTGNHPFKTVHGWTRADKLALGQTVAIKGSAEQWKPIEGWPYDVSSWGRVRSRDQIVMKWNPQSKKKIPFNLKSTVLALHRKYQDPHAGHLKVTLRRSHDATRANGNLKDFGVHQLVARAFGIIEANLIEARHLNGIAWDNTKENLAWGTSHDNKMDALAHGTFHRGKANQQKLTWAKVDYIRRAKAEINNHQLAKKLDVSRELVRDVRLGKKWIRHAAYDYTTQFSESLVKSVQLLPAEPTFGITVAKDHSHVTNGIITHNSGRFSSSGELNLQQIPVRSAEGKLLRNLFLADANKDFGVIDLSQIEFRLMVSDAVEILLDGAEEIAEQFRAGTADFHTLVAEMAGVDRSSAKTINFGIAFGEGAAKLSRALGLTQKEGFKFIEDYHTKVPFMRGLMKHYTKLALRERKIRTLYGRIRHFNIWELGGKAQLRRRAPSDQMANLLYTYRALNARIQGSAADILKRAMVAIHQAGLLDRNRLTLHITCHDELCFSVPRTKQGRADFAEAKRLMEVTSEITIPIVAEAGIGKSWGEAKH